MAAMAYNWPNEHVDVIVVTDGRWRFTTIHVPTLLKLSVFVSVSTSLPPFSVACLGLET